MQADDVARVSEVDHRLLLGHEGRRRRELHLLAAAYVQVVLVALEGARTYLQEGDAVAVVRVHVGVYLEDEARHLGLVGVDRTCLRGRGARRGGYAYEALEKFAHAEVVDGRSEEYGRNLPAQVGVAVEGVVDTLHKFEVLAQLRGKARRDV